MSFNAFKAEDHTEKGIAEVDGLEKELVESRHVHVPAQGPDQPSP